MNPVQKKGYSYIVLGEDGCIIHEARSFIEAKKWYLEYKKFNKQFARSRGRR